uniref:G protein-coupled receptor n=1 Tax=Caenorhabditis tropicalis TaxID=1561998 RepID=A0A1I7UU70_9PELO
MIASFNNAIPNQQESRDQFSILYPELQYLVVDDHVFFLCIKVDIAHVIFLAVCFFLLGISLLTIFFLIWMSNRALHKFHLSERTRKIHIHLIRSLCYQISVPIIAFYAPLIIVITPLVFMIPDSQVSFFIAIIFMSFHTFLGTLSMFYFNRHYRHWLVATIRDKKVVSSIPLSKFMVTREIIHQ